MVRAQGVARNLRAGSLKKGSTLLKGDAGPERLCGQPVDELKAQHGLDIRPSQIAFEAADRPVIGQPKKIGKLPLGEVQAFSVGAQMCWKWIGHGMG